MEITRAAAIAKGDIKYLSDKPCPNGHTGARYVRDYKCVACRVAGSNQWNLNNPEKHKASVKKHNLSKADFYNAERKKRYEKNKAHELERQNAYNLRNADKVRARQILYRTNNPHMNATKRARYRAAQIQRTPAWLTKDDFWVIREAYALASLRTKMLGIQFEVDHYVPLQGETVSGLHVPTNLQVIPRALNRSKSNHFEAV